MDEIDKKILNILQKEFPLEEHPFFAVAKKCGISEDEVISRVQRLKKEGIIRRIGAVFDGAILGRASTLCAARVPEEKLEKFVGAVNSYSGATHNYLRNNDYIVWFTVNAAGRNEIAQFLAHLKENTGVKDILEMQAVRTFKIDASFEM